MNEVSEQKKEWRGEDTEEGRGDRGIDVGIVVEVLGGLSMVLAAVSSVLKYLIRSRAV